MAGDIIKIPVILVPQSGPLEKMISEGIKVPGVMGGSAAGGKAAGAPKILEKVSAELAKISGINKGMFTKLGVIGVTLSVLSSLGPFVAILKMIFALLQITLRPLAELFLNILKPIFILLLRWFIIPFYKMTSKLNKWLDITNAGKSEAPTAAKGIGAILGLEGIIKSIIEIFTIFRNVFSSIIDAFKPMWSKINTIFEPLIKIFSDAVIKFKPIFEPFIKIFEDIILKLKPVLDPLLILLGEGGLTGAIGKVIAVFAKIIDPVLWISFIGDIVELISKTLKGLWEGNPVWVNFWTIIEKVGDVISKVFDILGLGMAIIKDLWTSISTLSISINNTVNWVNTAIESAKNLLSFRGISGSRATGGPVLGGSSYLVGEKGPEIFTPGSSGSITSNSKMGGTTLNITGNTFGSRSDIDYMVKEIEKKLYTNNKRAGNW